MTTELRRAAHWHRPLMILVSVMGVVGVVALIGVFADPRVLTGVPIWIKPFKFAISLGLYGLTLAWMLSLLPRRSRVAEWAGTAVVATAAAEMAVIVGQVVRGQTSHYNESTPLNGALWQVMGISIMILFVSHLVIAIAVLRQRLADRAAATAIRLGLGLSLLGMLAAIPMVMSRETATGTVAGAHSVGVADGGPGLPLVGWSTVGGDLRIGHFVGLHALQALPLLGLLLARFFEGRLPERTRVRLLVVAGAAYGLLTVLLTWQALRGQPLLRPDALTLAAATALVLATATASAAVIARGRHSELVLAA